jgi:uncharacterized membrane protein YtjA (UPF0391 family)
VKSDDYPGLWPLAAAARFSYCSSEAGAGHRWKNLESLHKGIPMLHYAIVFLVIALIAALFGFGGIAAGAAGIAKILFVVFLIGAVVAFLMNGRGSRI